MTCSARSALASAGVRPCPTTRNGTPHIIANISGGKQHT